MELRYFFSILAKRKWLLLGVMLASAAATYFLVSKLPKKYASSASVTTGITDFKGVRVDDPNTFVQEFELENKFANLIEYMKSRPAINPLTKKLMLHDLRPDSGQVPFRQLPLDKINITKEQIDDYLKTLDNNPDSLGVTDEDLQHLATARTLEKALGYDYETLRKKLEIKRNGKTDYVLISYVSENPKLTYFVTDNFVKEFLRFYYSKRVIRDSSSVAFYRILTAEKKRLLDSINNAFATYAKANGVVALTEQSQSVVSQIKELEMERDREKKRLAEASQFVEVYERENRYVADLVSNDYLNRTNNNMELIRLNDQISKLRNQYFESGMKDEKLKKQIDYLDGERVLVSKKIANARRANNDEVLMKKNEEVYMKYLSSKSEKVGSEEAIKAIERQLGVLRAKKAKLVENNADVSRLMQQMEIAQKEYEYAVERQNQADVIQESSDDEMPMRIIDQPLPPTQPLGNKALFMSAFAGVGTGTLATVFLFLLTFFDRSLSTPFQFSQLVGIRLIGVLNTLNVRRFLNFDNLFDETTPYKNGDFFKEALRRIRSDIENSGSQSFLVTSLKDREGKSFVVASLAYSLAMKNKKVLIIDTNFKNNTLTGLSTKQFENNPVTGDTSEMTANATRLNIDISLPSVDIIGNKGGHNSPSELLKGIDFGKKIRELGRKYDYIFLEASCINKYSDARELVGFVDKMIPVFDANTSISSVDREGIAFIKELGDKVLGGILNKADIKNVQ